MANKADKHIPAHEVNNVESKKHRSDRIEQQKEQGDKVVKWIFGVLVVLALIYMAWTVFLAQ